jgi:hypothetical protein
MRRFVTAAFATNAFLSPAVVQHGAILMGSDLAAAAAYR